MKALAILLAASAFQPQIPKTWTEAAVAALELPLANPKYSPVHISEQTYYRISERVIYKSYPVYHPSREPAGYMEWLKKQQPEIAFDPSELKTREDWIKAGEVVFNTPTSHSPVFFGAANLRDPSFYDETGMPVAKDGTIPFAGWVIRREGEVELGSMGCNTCHTRVMTDGTIIPGAQGNNPGDRQGAWMLRRAAQAGGAAQVLERVRGFARQFEMPWLSDDPNQRARTMSLDELIAVGQAIPPGVTARSNTSMFVPPRIPDLIGVRERRYLDNTGLVRHESIGDLMRYSSLVQDMGGLSRYGDSQPPPNPNRFGALAARGKEIFERERCARCHEPPLYTNNKLVAADGFEPPPGHKQRFDVMEERVGTDPRYTLETHKGTGYYKVPSLKGVWYRGPFEHNGSVATLEDWFDSGRLRDDYVPTGFKGAGVEVRAVKGHKFGLNLSSSDRAALIAFLKTL